MLLQHISTIKQTRMSVLVSLMSVLWKFLNVAATTNIWSGNICRCDHADLILMMKTTLKSRGHFLIFGL